MMNFSKIASVATRFAGQPQTFAIMLGLVLIWLVLGPIFAWSQTWQLIINSFTSIVTFLMVFLLQNSSNRGTDALQIKLDELLRSIDEADFRLRLLDELPQEELERLLEHYKKGAKKDKGGQA